MHFRRAGPWIRWILPSGLHNPNPGIHHLPQPLICVRFVISTLHLCWMILLRVLMTQRVVIRLSWPRWSKSLVSECWVGKEENAAGLDKLNQVWWNSKFSMSYCIPINKTLFLKVSLNLDVMLALFGEDMSKKNEYEFVYSYTRQQFYRWGAFPVLSQLQFLSRQIQNGFPQIFRVFDPMFAFCSYIQGISKRWAPGCVKMR